MGAIKCETLRPRLRLVNQTGLSNLITASRFPQSTNGFFQLVVGSLQATTRRQLNTRRAGIHGG